MDNPTLTITIDPREAVFLAGGAVLMLQKGISTIDRKPDPYTQMLGLSVLNKLADHTRLLDFEIHDTIAAAVDTAMSLTGDEVTIYEHMDGITKAEAEALM